MKTAVIAALVTNLVISFHAFAKQDTSSLKLVCSEFDATEADGERLGGLGQIATITIHFNPAGELQTIKIERKETSGLTKINQEFNRDNSQIEHVAVPNPVDQDGNPIHVYGIKNVETLTITSAGQAAFQLQVNDHAYAGLPGATATYTDGKSKESTSSLGNMMRCSGRVMFPWNTSSDSLEE